MDNLMLAEAREKGMLLNEAIKIIEKLSKNAIADIDDGDEDENFDELKNLVIKARSLTSDRWWATLR